MSQLGKETEAQPREKQVHTGLNRSQVPTKVEPDPSSHHLTLIWKPTISSGVKQDDHKKSLRNLLEIVGFLLEVLDNEHPSDQLCSCSDSVEASSLGQMFAHPPIISP